MKKIIYLLVGIILFGGLYYSCVPEELPGSIYGTVVDKATGEPIKSAGVELSPSGLKTVTGSEGQFEFTELDPGKYTLIITKTGYMDGVSHTIEVKPGQQAKGDVQIEKLPPALKVVNDNREEISTLDFGSAEDDVARSFSVFNDGTETLEWELTATADWIKSVSKTTGTLSAGATQAIIITIDRAKLSSGENKTTVHITSNSGNKQLVVTATNAYQPATLNVLPVTDIKSSYAVLHGEILTEGTPKYTERGFVYSESSKPTIENCIQQLTTPLTNETMFSIEVAGLMEGKTYYVRAYAINGGKAAYSSNEVSFTPKGTSLPKVATKSITDILLGDGKATVFGEIQELGDPAYTERGFVYGTNHNPIVQTATKVIVEGNGVGEFVATLSDLQLGNMYYVRAYAMNTVGVAYGEEQTLDFNPILPEVATNDVTGISEETKSATFHATITNVGNPLYMERGFVYGKLPDPTTGGATKVVVAGSGTGTYYSDVHNLELDCAYYVRAYVTYSLGTVYGENKTFLIKKTYPPTVTTSVVTQITTTTAVAGGNVTDDGGISVTERGVVFSTNQNPTIADNKVVSGTGLGDFICNLTNLQEGTTYHVRAYAINSKGTAYGEEVSFTTIAQSMATVTTTQPTNVSYTSATVGGNVTSDGGASVTERGICYSTSANPTTSNTKIANGTGTGSFSCNLTDLQDGTTYYIRAYAINEKGTAYGKEVSFTTTAKTVATVITSQPTNISNTSATAGGSVTNDGGASVTERGLVYGTSQNPTVADNKVSSGNGKGAFTCNLTNLKEATTYYVRAYAINEKGTAYGEEVSFTTSKEILLPSVTTSTITQVTETSAVAGGNVTSDGGASVTERGVCIATVSNPTTSNTKVKSGSGTGSFTCNVTNLQSNTTYYVRAYAVNSAGTAYGEQVIFTTNKQIVLPTVITSTITQITETTAVAGGTVTNDGNASVTERGVCIATVSNPTTLHSKVIAGSGMGSFTCNLTNLQSGTKYYVRAYAVNSKGTAYGEEISFTTNAPSNGTENGYEWVDLGLSVKWATMNVGASKPEDYGDYFAWGETQPKDYYDWSTYKHCNGSQTTLTKYNTSSSYGSVDNRTVLEASDDAARANWGGSWRMPTDAELTELREQCTWTWTTQNGVKGYKVTSKSNGNSIFFPAAGCRYDSSLNDAGIEGDYWSSSLGTDYPNRAWLVRFNSDYVNNVRNYIYYRCDGRSVRPVCP